MATINLIGEIASMSEVPGVNVGIGRTLWNIDILEDDEKARASLALEPGYQKDATPVPHPLSVTTDEGEELGLGMGDRVEVAAHSRCRQGTSFAFISARAIPANIVVTHKAATPSPAATKAATTPAAPTQLKDKDGNDIPF